MCCTSQMKRIFVTFRKTFRYKSLHETVNKSKVARIKIKEKAHHTSVFSLSLAWFAKVSFCLIFSMSFWTFYIRFTRRGCKMTFPANFSGLCHETRHTFGVALHFCMPVITRA